MTSYAQASETPSEAISRLQRRVAQLEGALDYRSRKIDERSRTINRLQADLRILRQGRDTFDHGGWWTVLAWVGFVEMTEEP